MKNIYRELNSIEIEKAIVVMVESLLPRNTQYKVLQIQLSFNLSKYSNDENDDIELYSDLTLLFYRPLNYTFVGTPINNNERIFELEDGTELKQESYHDSCWRTDGVSDAIKKHIKELITKADNIKENSDEWSVNTSFGLSPVKFYNAEIKINGYDKPSIFVKTI